MLTRFDPFRDFDRLFGSSWQGVASAGMPMDAYRHGDDVVVVVDLPGVRPDAIDATVEGNVLTVTAERAAYYDRDDTVFVSERPTGRMTRRIQLGSDLDGSKVQADYHDGVLTVRIPLAETAKPHRIQIGAGNGQQALAANAA